MFEKLSELFHQKFIDLSTVGKRIATNPLFHFSLDKPGTSVSNEHGFVGEDRRGDQGGRDPKLIA